jgi:hypothetical protein
MMAEAAAIWRQQEVAIECASERRAVARAQSRFARWSWNGARCPTRVDGPFAVGELVRSANSHSIALISIERAEWLVASCPQQCRI